MTADLIQHLFMPLFRNEAFEALGDSALVKLQSGDAESRFAFTTDSFVIHPLFFPGGDIGELAVFGTVNDLAMVGAQPIALSAGFILEEGLPIETLGKVAASMSAACKRAGVTLVTGDTKVVNRGHGDGIFINTSGIGIIPSGITIAPTLAQSGDIVIISGTVGDHGMAVMSVREGLEFATEIQSDTAPLNDLVNAMLAVAPHIHCLRDATRGGLGAVLNELAVASRVGIEFSEAKVPVSPAVSAACEMLGFDPLYVANEGKLVAIVPEEEADRALSAMHSHGLGQQAAIIGQVTESHPGIVAAKTTLGATRVIDLPPGELLPRIC
jgi:hydrogenase expression/formation protein HypE